MSASNPCPIFRSDRVLVALREPGSALAAPSLAALRDRGCLAGIDRVWIDYPERAARGEESAGFRPANTVDPRVRERLAAILRGVAVLRLQGADAAAVVEDCRRDPAIAHAARVPVRRLSGTSRRGPRRPQWNQQVVRIAEARRLPGFDDAREIHVALLDSGVDTAHPDLRRTACRGVHVYAGAEFAASADDLAGHGTHLAGLLAGDARNRLGLRGLCSARVSAFKITGDEPVFVSPEDGFAILVEESAWLAALARCAEERVDAVMLGAVGTHVATATETALLELLHGLEIPVIAPMGNDREQGSPVSAPAALPGVIAVAATGVDDSIAGFSSAGPHVALAAPGVGIWSCLPLRPGAAAHRYDPELGPARAGRAIARACRYGVLDGTSLAAAHVSAAVALLFAMHGKDSPARVRERLMTSAWRPRAMRGELFDHDYGAGILDVLALLSS
jgi:hypothetical protein